MQEVSELLLPLVLLAALLLVTDGVFSMFNKMLVGVVDTLKRWLP